MSREFLLRWSKAALIRTIRTFVQTLLASIVMSETVYDVPWRATFSVALLAALASLLSAVKGLPEVSLPITEQDA